MSDDVTPSTPPAPPAPRMPEDDPLFRREAVEEYLRGRDHGHLLNVSPLLSVWSFALLLAVFAGAVAFAAFTRIGTDVRGQAIVRHVPDDSTRFEVVCVLPADARPGATAPRRRVVVDFGAATPQRLTLTPLAEAFAYDAAHAREALGAEAASTAAIAGPVVLVRAPLPAPAAGSRAWLPGTSGTAGVRTGEQTLLSALLFQKVTP
ncbi:MAG: hypothetical protein IPJ04_18105 [Candidatus Eisenbacteria bacterium]|nr:hypothetical protein [Candidatus Eisenbacteria bacterium]